MNRTRYGVLGALISLFSELLERLTECLPVIGVRIDERREVESWVVENVFVGGGVGGGKEEIGDFVVDALVVLDLDYELADALVGSSPDQLGGFVLDEWVVELPQVLLLVDIGRHFGEQCNLFGTGLSHQIFFVGG